MIEIDCAGVTILFLIFFPIRKNSKSWQKELYIRGDMHFNQKGNFVLAEIIADQLKN